MITRPPTRPEMVPVFLQRGALQDGHPCSGPVSLADGGLLEQSEPPDADLQGGEVGRLTHAQVSEGAGFALCASALCLPRCSSGGRCGHDERERRTPFAPLLSATRQRCRAREPPRRSCMWCACSLPRHHGKGSHFVWVPEKKRKTIPVLTLMAHCANRLSCYLRVHTNTAQLLAMSAGSTVGFVLFLRVG
jgi:hypothetical protein